MISEDGKELGVGELGELCFRGPNLMTGYLNRPQDIILKYFTRIFFFFSSFFNYLVDIIDKDGFLHTGDIGYVDENGYWFIVDRLKELIKYKGFQVCYIK